MKIFDATLGRLERSLDVRLTRHNALAGNLANVDTPGYKPKDIDFAAAMAAVSGGEGSGPTTVHTTTQGHLATATGTAIGGAFAGSAGDIPLVDTSGESPGMDGNRVDLDRTMATLAENGMQYGASARAASKKLAILRYVAGDGNG
jgi:flagellar basal-body rod protein FlgB